MADETSCGCFQDTSSVTVQWYQRMAFVALIFFTRIFIFHIPISCYQSLSFSLLFFFFFSFLFLFLSSSFSFTSLKQSKNISVMVCIVVSLRVFHKALKEKIPVFPIKSTLHHHQCVSCLTPRREYNWLRWSKSMK